MLEQVCACAQGGSPLRQTSTAFRQVQESLPRKRTSSRLPQVRGRKFLQSKGHTCSPSAHTGLQPRPAKSRACAAVSVGSSKVQRTSNKSSSVCRFDTQTVIPVIQTLANHHGSARKAASRKVQAKSCKGTRRSKLDSTVDQHTNEPHTQYNGNTGQEGGQSTREHDHLHCSSSGCCNASLRRLSPPLHSHVRARHHPFQGARTQKGALSASLVL